MDLKSGNFPIGVVIFGLIALLLALRLRSVLGKRTGLDRPLPRTDAPPSLPNGAAGRGRPGPAAQDEGMRGRLANLRGLRGAAQGRTEAARGPLAPATATAAPAPTRYVLPESGSSAGQALTTLTAMQPQFDPGTFLRGAEHCFRTVVAAFAQGDRDALRKLLAADAFEAFETVIAAREAAQQRQHSEIRHLAEVALIAAEIGQDAAADAAAHRGPTLEVRFVSDQISYVTDARGDAVSGADAVTELCDVWSFEAGAGTPAASPAGGLAGEPDGRAAGLDARTFEPGAWRVSATRSA